MKMSTFIISASMTPDSMLSGCIGIVEKPVVYYDVAMSNFLGWKGGSGYIDSIAGDSLAVYSISEISQKMWLLVEREAWK